MCSRESGMFVTSLLLPQHANNSEIRILKMLLLIVLIVTNRVRAFLDVEFSLNVNVLN